MINTPYNKEHFNLYYIYKEDKEQKSLPKAKVDKLCKQIFQKLKEKEFS